LFVVKSYHFEHLQSKAVIRAHAVILAQLQASLPDCPFSPPIPYQPPPYNSLISQCCC
jgi:hypothetical protein